MIKDFKKTLADSKKAAIHLAQCESGLKNCTTCETSIGYLVKNWAVAIALGIGAITYFLNNQKQVTGPKKKKGK